MRTRSLLLFLAMFVPSFAAEPDAPLPTVTTPLPTVTTTLIGGVTTTNAQLAGRLVDWTLLAEGSGRQRIVLLEQPGPADDSAETPKTPCRGAAPAKGSAPRAVIELTLAGTASLVTRLEGLAADVVSIGALDVDGDGRDELLLAHQGGTLDLVRVPPEGAWTVQAGVVRDADLGHVVLPGAARGNRRVPGGQLHLAADGAFRTYAFDAAANTLKLSGSAALPLDARLSGDDLVLHTGTPRFAGTGAEGPVFVTHPEQAGAERLKATVVRPAAAPEARSVPCFFKLPGTEAVLRSDTAVLDGRPVLAVMTRKSDKLRIFGEQSIRVFALGSERTRAGQPPVFAAETGAKWYQAVDPVVVDVDGDGRTELVLPYWEGLVHDKVTLEVFGRTADGTLEASAHATTLGAKNADKGFVRYGSDVDGDGVPDLVIKADGGLLVHRGRPGNRDRNVVEDTAAWRVPLPGDLAGFSERFVSVGDEGALSTTSNNGGEPVVADLDGDGRADILAVSTPGTHRPRLIVARFATPAH